MNRLEAPLAPRVRKLASGVEMPSSGYGDALGSRSAAYDQMCPPRGSADGHLASLEQRVEATDQALAESLHREDILKEMLSEAKASIQSLGEEADYECHQLQHELQLKQVEYSEAVDELRAASRIMGASDEWSRPNKESPRNVDEDSASGLIQELRLALAESQAECASIQRELDERLAKENNETELLCEAADREAVATNAIRESSRWMAERDVLREEMGRLRAETQALRENQEEVWRQHVGKQERLHADVVQLQRLVNNDASHERAPINSGYSSAPARVAEARKVPSLGGVRTVIGGIPNGGSYKPPGPLGEGPAPQSPDEIRKDALSQ